MELLRYTSATLTLYIAVDNSFAVSLNNVVIEPGESNGFGQIYTYDLKPWFVGTTAQSGEKENTLVVSATNTGGIGGVILKVELVVY